MLEAFSITDEGDLIPVNGKSDYHNTINDLSTTLTDHPIITIGAIRLSIVTAVAATVIIAKVVIALFVPIVIGLILYKVGKWIYDYFRPGSKYVNEHPYFTVDTFKLTAYASRFDSVNSRLSSLDKRLDSLYW